MGGEGLPVVKEKTWGIQKVKEDQRTMELKETGYSPLGVIESFNLLTKYRVF